MTECTSHAALAAGRGRLLLLLFSSGEFFSSSRFEEIEEVNIKSKTAFK